MNSDLIQFAVLASSALACALLAPFLVLKRMAMFANSLSHTSLLGIALAYLISVGAWGVSGLNLSVLLMGAVFAALLTALLTEGLGRVFRLGQEASIGLIFVTLFALGVVVVTLFTKQTHLSVEAVLGNPDALQLTDLQFAAPMAFLNFLCVTLFFRPLQMISFDESFAKAMGVRVFLWRSVLIFLTSLTCIASFRAVGALVVLTLLTAPYLTARLFCSKLVHLLILTPLLAILLVGGAVLLSRACLDWFFPLSTAGILATLCGVVFSASACTYILKRGDC